MRSISFGFAALLVVLGPFAYWAVATFIIMDVPAATPHMVIEEDDDFMASGTCTSDMAITTVRMRCRDQSSPGTYEFDGDLGCSMGIWSGSVSPTGWWDHISNNYLAQVSLQTSTDSAIFEVVEDTGP